MTIGAVVDLTRAELQNKPAINRFESVACSLTTLKRGGLFIAFDEDDIPQALEKGAYGVLTSHPHPILDEECAWLVVANLEKCVTHLLKFTLLDSSITLIAADEPCFTLSSQLIRDPKVTFHTTPCDALEALFGSTSSTFALLPQTITQALEPRHTLVTHPFQRSMPSETFHAMDRILDDQLISSKLPAPYHATCDYLVETFESLQIAYTIPSTFSTPFFAPHFVTSSLMVADFGQTHTLVIFSQATDEATIEHEIATTAKMIPWGRTIAFIPKGQHSAKLSYNKTIVWDTPSFISDWLTAHKWEVAIIYGVNKEEILKTPLAQPTLF